jgi:hypothetical protein
MVRMITFVSTFAALAICGWWSVRSASAEIVCADDLAPQGMAITTTGTSPSCAGSCRARELKPVCGPVMKICASQPIPKGYVLDSITTTPACACLGEEDNAYVIRYIGVQAGTDMSEESAPYPSGEPDVYSDDQSPGEDQTTSDLSDQESTRLSKSERYPYGNPPFGNVLCAEASMQMQPYASMPQSAAPQARDFAVPSNPLQPSNTLQPSDDGTVPPPSWNQTEPFRVGQ